MGYNVVWGGWLAGIQSEVSLNRNNIRLEGAGQTTTNTTTFNQTFAIPNVLNPSSSVSYFNERQNFTNFLNLENKWTVSEMVRLGYLLRPDWLVYGLVGWSWGGFEAFSGDTPFTLNGLTYGAGVEKDFGWLRAFVQYKGINYDSKGINFSSPFSSNSTTINPQATTFNTFSRNTADSAGRSFSADVHQVTAGITVPINFNRW